MSRQPPLLLFAIALGNLPPVCVIWAQSPAAAAQLLVRRLVKSYCLSPIRSRSVAAENLDSLLPGQRDPWLLKDASGDVMAYFHLDEDGQPSVLTVGVDISGRHYDCDAEVVSVLGRLRDRVGGEITNDA